MLGTITRAARLAADSAAQAATKVATKVADLYAYPSRRDTYPVSMPVGRRAGGPGLALALLLALGLLYLAIQGGVKSKGTGVRSPTGAKPLQTWEGEGGATPADD